MQCPHCKSNKTQKNGKRGSKQNHPCRDCGRQFIDVYSSKGYSNEVKQQCLTMYVNGMGFRAIERVTGVHHTTVIYWVKQLGSSLADAPIPESIPQVGELDELETFVGSKKNKIWLWTAVNHFTKGMINWVVGDHSGETFEYLWNIVCGWNCYFYVTDG